MEQIQISSSGRFLPLYAKYPWLVVQSEAEEHDTIITGDNGFLHTLTCNGNAYILNTVCYNHVGELPFSSLVPFRKRCCTYIFYILVGFQEEIKKTLGLVYLPGDYVPAVSSTLGDFIHMGDEIYKIIYLYKIMNKTISLSSMSCLLPTNHMSLLGCSLQGDYEVPKCTADSRQEEIKDGEIVLTSVTDYDVENESHLLNLPFHILEMITEFCFDVEYMFFRATCKRYHLAAPPIEWSNGTTSSRLHIYSFVSPWLIVLDIDHGIITLTHPLIGDKYFEEKVSLSSRDDIIYCSRFGWLLFYDTSNNLVLFNPFTSDIRKLPDAKYTFERLSFSAPPTSSDCMVVGFARKYEWLVCIHFVAGEQSWRMFSLDFGGADPYYLGCPTFYGRNLYVLTVEGQLYVFRGLGEEDYSWGLVIPEPPTSFFPSLTVSKHFLVQCDQHLVLVIVGIGPFKECIELYKLNDYAEEWEKMDGLGKHAIYICDESCLSIESKTLNMENKIYFSGRDFGKGKITFYSFETCKYHTFSGNNIGKSLEFEDFYGTHFHFFPSCMD